MKRIKIIGIGGGGCAIANLINEKNLFDADFYAINMNDSTPDNFKTHANSCKYIGKYLTELTNIFLDKNAKSVILLSCFSSSIACDITNTVAKIIADLNIPIVSVITTPFSFEGEEAISKANLQIEKLKEYGETIVVPNDLFTQKLENNSFDNVFVEINEYISSLITVSNDNVFINNIIPQSQDENIENDNFNNLKKLVNYNLDETIKDLKQIVEYNNIGPNKLPDEKINMLINILSLNKNNATGISIDDEELRNNISETINELENIISAFKNLPTKFFVSHKIYLLLELLKICDKNKDTVLCNNEK